MDTTQSKLDLKTKSIQKKDAKSNKYANKPAEGHAKKLTQHLSASFVNSAM